MKPVLVIQNCDAESPGTIIDYLRERQISYSHVYSFAGQTLPAPSEAAAAIVLGCPLSVNAYREHAYLRSLYEFATQAVREQLPYLGICFGGQLLAKVLGAEVRQNPVKEIGTYQVKLTEDGKKDPLLDGFEDIFGVFQWHGDTFKVPFGATLLVEGNECKNQAFRTGNFVALQFHLETPLSEVSIWCDRYQHELIEVRKSRDTILDEYRRHEAAVKTGNYQLLDNFFRLLVP